MPTLKLTYFDFDGGRGESIRLALAMGGIPFEDDRFGFDQWPDQQAAAPLHQVPVMEVDGEVITQSNAMNRYVGKLSGLYPDDALEALHCDETMAAVEDVLGKIVTTFGIEDDEEMRKAREALTEGPLTLYLGWFGNMLAHRGGRYFAGDRLSVADLKVFVWIRSLNAGLLDYVPIDLVERLAPNLMEHCQRVEEHPKIQAYYQERAASKD